MAAGLSREISITEYSPKKIKMAITGNGSASKEQVAKMLQQLLKIKTLPRNLDATDGLAAAVCHYYNMGKKNKEKKLFRLGGLYKSKPQKNKILKEVIQCLISTFITLFASRLVTTAIFIFPPL
jgi:crossover junction endodeoxyribonuclease RuvC